jgi:20S proteasome subunit alpha 2
VRPFGVSLLMAGHDTHGPQLYQIDPSGSYFAWKASAIGKNMTNAKTFLEKRYSEARSAHARRSLSPRRPTVRYP